MKKILIIFAIASLIMFTIFINISVNAISTDKYKDIYNNPGDPGVTHVFNKAGGVLGVIQVVGTSLSVIMVTVAGVKYMISSVQEKAKAKEQLILILIGAILLFGGTNILTYVAKWSNGL